MIILSNLQAEEYKNFEEIKKIREDGTEYWNARELSEVLQYKKWENFSKVIDRAKLACDNSGLSIQDHFPEVRKMVEIGSNTVRELLDYELSRYACYLIVQNGDPRKEVIALGQTYFAIQTRKQEVADYFNQLDEDNKRLVIRGDVKQYANEIICFYSDNDSYVRYEVEKDFADTVATEQVLIPKGGHINSESGYDTFEEIVTYL